MITVKGFPFGNDSGDTRVSVRSMTTKTLCATHNSQLSEVDTEGSRFFTDFFKMHNGLLGGNLLGDRRWEYDGLLVERWMLKCLCGIVASGQGGIDEKRVGKANPPGRLLNVVFGDESLLWPLGLYVNSPVGETYIPGKELRLTPYFHEEDAGYPAYGLQVEYYRFMFTLCLADPSGAHADVLPQGALYRPNYFNFTLRPDGHRVEMAMHWPEPRTGNGFVYDVKAGRPAG